MRGEPFDRDEIAEQIAPCFEEIDGRRTDIVVLACTHYPFLADVMAEIAPWPVTWLDPAPAIARRLAKRARGAGGREGRSRACAVFTGGRAPPRRLSQLLAEHGLRCRRPPTRV